MNTLLAAGWAIPWRAPTATKSQNILSRAEAGMAIACLSLPKKREKGFGFFLVSPGERSYPQAGQR
jgi:hypothetical protein